MNTVVLFGNVGSDPEVRHTGKDMTVANISLATTKSKKSKDGNGYENVTTWHKCVAFGKTAETIQKHVQKGAKILVTGEIDNYSYEKKDGSKGYGSQILIDRFEFGGAKADAPQQAPATTPASNDDIPF